MRGIRRGDYRGVCNSVVQHSSCCELRRRQRGREPILWESGPNEINEHDTLIHQVFETDVTAPRSGSSFETKADSPFGGKATCDAHYIRHTQELTAVVVLLRTF